MTSHLVRCLRYYLGSTLASPIVLWLAIGLTISWRRVGGQLALIDGVFVAGRKEFVAKVRSALALLELTGRTRVQSYGLRFVGLGDEMPEPVAQLPRAILISDEWSRDAIVVAIALVGDAVNRRLGPLAALLDRERSAQMRLHAQLRFVDRMREVGAVTAERASVLRTHLKRDLHASMRRPVA